ncbi:MAG: hypothetical protein U0074_05325 [Kouleothrix sp.]
MFKPYAKSACRLLRVKAWAAATCRSTTISPPQLNPRESFLLLLALEPITTSPTRLAARTASTLLAKLRLAATDNARLRKRWDR